jgi:hypothetical protein
VAVDDVRIVFEIEGDIGSLALEKDRRLAQRVRIADFVENVKVGSLTSATTMSARAIWS